jgi:exodeoxyribonuclease VII small subunit
MWRDEKLAKKRSKPRAQQDPSLEQSLEQLETIVDRLEGGEIGLTEALEQYEKGVRLLRACYDQLEKAERRIELLSGVDAEGKPISSAMDDPSASADDKAPGRGRSTDVPPLPSEPDGGWEQ